jgi:hypothetical protein
MVHDPAVLTALMVMNMVGRIGAALGQLGRGMITDDGANILEYPFFIQSIECFERPLSPADTEVNSSSSATFCSLLDSMAAGVRQFRRGNPRAAVALAYFHRPHNSRTID